jgi:hypothetical protein
LQYRRRATRGWEQKTTSPNVTKLIRTDDGTKAGRFLDIQVTTKSGVLSYLKVSVAVVVGILGTFVNLVG